MKIQKTIIIYGQTDTKEKSAHKKKDELNRVRIASEAGFYYVPLYEEERIGNVKYGVQHEEKNSWHYMDTGQHFITQVFLNVLELSEKCQTMKEEESEDKEYMNENEGEGE